MIITINNDNIDNNNDYYDNNNYNNNNLCFGHPNGKKWDSNKTIASSEEATYTCGLVVVN